MGTYIQQMHIKPIVCVYSRGFGAAPWVRRLLVVGIAQLRSGFSSRPVRVGFFVERVALVQVFLRLLRFNFPANTISPMAHFQSFVTGTVDGVFKLHTFHSTSYFFSSCICFSWIRQCRMTVRVRREVSLRSSICTVQSVSAHVSVDKRQRT